MNRIVIVLGLLLVVLSGCTPNVESECEERFCIDADEYGISGSVFLDSLEKGTATFSTTMEDFDGELVRTYIKVYEGEEVHGYYNGTSLNEFINSDDIHYPYLLPDTDYYVVFGGYVKQDKKTEEVIIDFLDFTTASFERIRPVGEIENVLIADTFVVCDFSIDSNDYDVNTYYLFLYQDGQVVGDYLFYWGDYSTGYREKWQVFKDLTPNTEYQLVLKMSHQNDHDSVTGIYEEFSITFTTKE